MYRVGWLKIAWAMVSKITLNNLTIHSKEYFYKLYVNIAKMHCL